MAEKVVVIGDSGVSCNLDGDADLFAVAVYFYWAGCEFIWQALNAEFCLTGEAAVLFDITDDLGVFSLSGSSHFECGCEIRWLDF